LSSIFRLTTQVKVKAVVAQWTLKPTSTPANPKMRSVPELLAALPEVLDGVVVLAPELVKGLHTLCNVTPPSDVSIHPPS
jgi:hypothetical protein